MPKISDILDEKKSKSFKKRDYRPWNPPEEKQAAIEPPIEDKVDEPKEVSKKSVLQDEFKDSEIYELSCDKITNWEFSDRPESELGDIEALALDLKNIGQQQPCIVRPSPSKAGFYELIIGERRWRAATKAGIKLKAIIKNLSDSDAALAQSAENDNRKDLSDYAKGMSYSKLIDRGVIEQKDLIEKLGKSRQYVSALLSFSKVPLEIREAIGDMSKVSSRTAETIKQLSLKGEAYTAIIIENAEKIGAGLLGHEKLRKKVEDALQGNKRPEVETTKILSKSGRHIFTWRKDNNHNPSIHFPKDLIELIDSGKLNLDGLTNRILESIEEELSKL